MPNQASIAVDSDPRLHGIFDTVNATLAASDRRLRLPDGFYDAKARAIMNRILMEEEYAGYYENSEYRRLGIGPILGRVVQGMVRQIVDGNAKGQRSQDVDGEVGLSKFSLYGCHDSTLAATLASLGVRKEDGWDEDWPGYTSSLAVELFCSFQPQKGICSEVDDAAADDNDLRGRYVRLRYNDVPIRIPGCRASRDHLEGDNSFCTLVSHLAFILDQYTVNSRRGFLVFDDWKVRITP